MTRIAGLFAVLLASTLLVGCGNSRSTAVATDPESVKKLEELQKKGAQREK